MAMLWTALQYLFHPRVIFTHVVALGLMYDLHNKNTGYVKTVTIATVEEVVTFLLWMIIPNSWATILSLAVCIYVYEKVTGPRVKIQENAIFFSDEDISDVLHDVSPGLNFDVWKQETGGYHIHTDLNYVEYSTTLWGKAASVHATAVNLDSVINVQPGYEFNIAKAIRASNAENNNCFKFITNIGDKTVTFIAPSEDVRNKWLTAFQQLYGKMIEDVKVVWLEKLFLEANITDRESPVSLDNAVKLLNLAHRPTDKPYVKEIFQTFAKTGSKTGNGSALTQDNFSKFFDIASRRPHIHDIYLRLLDNRKGETVLNPTKFRNFLQFEQKENVPTSVAKNWIKQSENLLPGFNLTTVGFTTHLLSEDHSIFKRDCRQVYQDMHQPLSHYFIATSHNTYLTKDQLRSKSSVDMYVQAFKRGCKCVELDCWDGPTNEPIVFHGHTLTSKIMFRDIIKAVGEHAFAVSDFPVILSFENHCSVEQQKVMAQHLTEILGDKLYTTPVPENEKKLKSPEQLRGYVIVKNKKLKEGVDETEEEDDEFSDDEINEEEVKEIMEKEQDEDHEDSPDKKKNSIRKLFSEIKLPKRSSSKKSKAPKLAQELSDLVHYCQASSFKGFNYAKEHLQHYEMSSFGEKKIFKYAADSAQTVLEYTRKHMARTYPAGGRVDSSNYDPSPLWNVGCQLVALNYQTGTYPMQLNQGLFQDNGFCGYVLKPQFMRNDNSNFNPKGPFDDNRAKKLAIRVICGNQIPYKSESHIRKDRELHVTVRIAGVEADVQKEKTKTIKNNGYNPVWEDELQFRVNVPELAIVSFIALESSSTFLGQYTLPLRCMQQGFRIIPLQNKMSEAITHSNLFVHVDYN